ncbi:MAG: hypothetical protein PHU12_01575 [Candidatus Aenigmarchaeota archaeon]|nr:hypothetical protein [Candidatus Aenigmarchaeota archaeon]
MGVISVNLKSIQATKNENLSGGIEVNNNVTPIDVRELDMPGIGKKGIVIDFQYISKYSVNGEKVAEIKILGEVYYIGSDMEEILKKWKKEKEMPEDPYIVIINTIFRRCAVKALQLAEDIQLPPPIGLPFAQKSKQE